MKDVIIEYRYREDPPDFSEYYEKYERRIRAVEESGRELELRYNHNHDEKGRFTFSSGGAKRVDKSEKSAIIKSGEKIVALENQRYGRNKDTLVDKSFIDSGAYRRKFDNATDSKEVNKSLYDCSKKALKHRSGTEYEDMYWIDGDTGNIIHAETDSKLSRGIAKSDKITKALKNANNIVAVHTHPSSMPPSIDDFNSFCDNHYSKAFVACHNGRVFWYSSEQIISSRLYNLYIGEYLSKGFSEFDSQWKTLEKLRENHAIDFGEVLDNG